MGGSGTALSTGGTGGGTGGALRSSAPPFFPRGFAGVSIAGVSIPRGGLPIAGGVSLSRVPDASRVSPGVVRALHERGSLSRVFCTETRPYNQGSRLSALELRHDGVPVTLIADSAAAAAMRERGVQGEGCWGPRGDTGWGWGKGWEGGTGQDGDKEEGQGMGDRGWGQVTRERTGTKRGGRGRGCDGGHGVAMSDTEQVPLTPLCLQLWWWALTAWLPTGTRPTRSGRSSWRWLHGTWGFPSTWPPQAAPATPRWPRAA